MLKSRRPGTHTSSAHAPSDLMDQVDSPRDVGINHEANRLEVLIKEGVAKTTTGIGQADRGANLRLRKVGKGKRHEDYFPD